MGLYRPKLDSYLTKIAGDCCRFDRVVFKVGQKGQGPFLCFRSRAWGTRNIGGVNYRRDMLGKCRMKPCRSVYFQPPMKIALLAKEDCHPIDTHEIYGEGLNIMGKKRSSNKPQGCLDFSESRRLVYLRDCQPWLMGRFSSSAEK